MDDDERQRVSKAPPPYEGQDLSPTTDRELRGFYAYGLAAEVFAVCGVGTLDLWKS
jgi:UMF1 family MFS transporter